MKHHANFEPFLSLWPWAQHSNAMSSIDNPAYDDVQKIKGWLQKDQWFRRFSIWAFTSTVTLTFKTQKPTCLHDTLALVDASTCQVWWWERFSGLEEFVRTNSYWHFEVSLWPWPWTQQSTFLSQDKPRLVEKGSAVQKLNEWMNFFLYKARNNFHTK